jgi:two-component system phosphate regulon response regulator PhoB
MKRVLIIEDEKDLADLLAFNLEKEGYQPSCAYDGSTGLAIALDEIPDLVILDLMLPGMMGTEVCRKLRNNPDTAATPILMLTARSEEIDRVVGFEVGADDYLAKPFSMRELMLRIKAILRRGAPSETPSKQHNIAIGVIAIDSERHTVLCNGRSADLTSTEYKLLLYLAERPDRVLSRELLLQQVWGYNYLGDTRTVDTHITRLRSKLGVAGEQIKTVRGFGYKIEATP